MSDVILSILGTAQDAGVPQPNCFCDNCLRALHDPAFKRTAASLALIVDDQWHLIDATPDLKDQMASLQMRHAFEEKLMSQIFLTHAHLGHYPGLLFLGREAINANKLPVFAGIRMKQLLTEHAPWSLLTKLDNISLRLLEDRTVVSIADNVTVTALNVPHRNEFSETFGFWIEGPNKKVLYIPDIDTWEEWDLSLYDLCAAADICLLDGTFFSTDELAHIGRDFTSIPHPVMTETIERLQTLTDDTAIYFIHLNHSNPVLDETSAAYRFVTENGFLVAADGMDLTL